MEFIHPKKKKPKYKGKFTDISKMSGIDVLFLLLFHLLDYYQNEKTINHYLQK